ncbi:PD-(D/E)XK nuclease family protein [Domibacillus sp. A3M-37]|nr:PD-(D/E)XK nuclease family protein [Domibacillus sp. A3M-37]MCP3761705.1 PD-(D/E)XK nuclease family protein [Domibacillus sp. A3M-37]
MDILILLNGNTAILIEDKTYTKDHSDQLIRYRKVVEKDYPNHLQLPIYYKSGSQSHYRSCKIAGYQPFLREGMIDIMNEGKSMGVRNHIFLDYLKRLEQIEAGYQSYRWLPIDAWTSLSWQGFYRLLQKELKNGGWGYVANARGGFQGFWWSKKPENVCYFQLEEKRLCIKIVERDKLQQRDSRLKASAHLLKQPSIEALSFQKPARSKNGQTMTVMVKSDYVQLNQDGILDVQATVEMLKEIEKHVDLSKK